jgi:orotidine-5'-phosphate decarboxylase
MSTQINVSPADSAENGAPVPIVALDVASASAAIALVRALPDTEFFKIGLQLYTAAGPDIVRRVMDAGKRVFLDLKYHDIPNTVAGAVRSAGALGIDLLTVHASGGLAMLSAAAEAAASSSKPPKIFAVTVLTSLSAPELATTWGRPMVDATQEAARLAQLACDCGIYGVVTSVHEVEAIRRETRHDYPVLTPGIRMPGDAAGDQSRVATPADAARVGADYVVLGRSVTGAADPAAAYSRMASSLLGEREV